MINKLCTDIISKHDLDVLFEVSDGSAAHAYDTGSTEVDIYTDALRMANEAGTRPIQVIDLSDHEVTLYFIGTEDEVEKLLQDTLNLDRVDQ